MSIHVYSLLALQVGLDLVNHLDGGNGDARAWAEDGGDVALVEVVIVLGRDDATGNDENVLAAQFGQLFHEGRDEGLVAGGKGTGANDMDIGIDRLLCSFGRRGKQWSNVNVETKIGESGGDDFGAPVKIKPC